MIFKVLNVIFIFLIAPWTVLECRTDAAEGSRLLEEAFRDYDKRIRPNYGGTPVMINVSFHILSISEVDPSSMTYTMSFFIRQMWTDPRLSFNSRRNIDTITLDASSTERIWSPDTFFVNELSSVNHDVLVKNQFCRISQDGAILLSRRVTLTAFAPMNSNWFPYDSHTLPLELESYGLQMKDLKYQWGIEEIHTADLNPPHPPGYVFTGVLASDSSKTSSTGSYSRLSIAVNVKRDPLPHELGIMLPACLLSYLCYCTIWIEQSGIGLMASIYLISMNAILYGQLVYNSSISKRGTGYSPCMSPMHIYVLLSCGFGLICLLINLKKQSQLSQAPSKVSSELNESKSRTESTSENCKLDELQGVVAKSLGKCTGMKQERRRKLLACVRVGKCGSTWRCFTCHFLSGIIFILWNAAFLGVCRYLLA